jgi:hypothetical protein
MTRARIGPLLAATAIAAVLYHGLSGHGLPQVNHDGMAGATAGLCLLLATALGYAAVPKPEVRPPSLATAATPTYVGPPRCPSVDGKARASPSTLQRFRN